MLTFLLFGAAGILAAVLAFAVVLPLILIGGLLRMIFWPLGFLFRVLGAFVVLPVIGALAVIGIGVALVVAALSLLLPLVPLVLLAAFGWAVYRLSFRRPAPTPSADAWW